MFVVAKPAGLHSVQLQGGRGGRSVADELLSARPELTTAGRSPHDGGLVHRLDQDTSGVLLGASSREAWESLFAQLSRGEIAKSYVACVEGRFPPVAEISSYIGSPYRGAKKMRSYPNDPGSSSRALLGSTSCEILAHNAGLNASLVAASASPARRHQVRIHLASLGHPLVGDSLYGSTRALGALVPASRKFFLHAWRISFTHPETGDAVTVECPYAPEIAWPL